MSSQAEKRMAGNNEKHCTVRPFHLPQARITKLPTMQDVIISLKLPTSTYSWWKVDSNFSQADCSVCSNASL